MFPNDLLALNDFKDHFLSMTIPNLCRQHRSIFYNFQQSLLAHKWKLSLSGGPYPILPLAFTSILFLSRNQIF
ncbi:hypothetical protein BD770DRAFT_385233 [Pilaira anomala]|nr:hypothetical protein BD770DRAFT_385233 [Pilaira anomala]